MPAKTARASSAPRRPYTSARAPDAQRGKKRASEPASAPSAASTFSSIGISLVQAVPVDAPRAEHHRGEQHEDQQRAAEQRVVLGAQQRIEQRVERGERRAEGERERPA